MLNNLPKLVTLLSAVTTGTSTVLDASGRTNVTLYCESVGTTSGGTLIIEEASTATYSGTWSQIQSVSASSFTGTAQQAYHMTGQFRFVRVRISSNITGGGTVSVTASLVQ